MKCKFHRYKRLFMGKNKTLFYKCTDCGSYQRPETLIGNEARCFFDDVRFKINKHLMYVDSNVKQPRMKLHCGCRFEKNKPALKPVPNFAQQAKTQQEVINKVKGFDTLDDILKDIVNDK